MSKKKSSQNTSKKTSKKKTYDSYYLIHNNGSRSMVVTLSKKTIKVYEILNDEDEVEEKIKNKVNMLTFKNYTSDDKNAIIYVVYKPVFTLSKCKKIFIGYDVEHSNTFIKNKQFGKGNSILAYDGKHYYLIYYDFIDKIKPSLIKGGEIIKYISPIGNNDVPYPMMFTKTHLYSWCENIDEYKIPDDPDTKKIIKLLCKAKNPFQIPKESINDVKKFNSKYVCRAGKNHPILKHEMVYEY